jgi:hypothetical protein
MRKFMAVASLLAALPVASNAISGAVTLVNTPALAIPSTSTAQNLINFLITQGVASKLSAQVTYASATIAPQNFIDGSVSSGSITVASNVILAQPATDQITVPATSVLLGNAATDYFTVITSTGLGQGATAQITIVSTNPLVNPIITLTGSGAIQAIGGVNWFQLGTTSATAQSLGAFIAGMSGVTGIQANWGGGTSNVVYCTATVNGLATNSYSVTSSTYNGIITTTAFSGAVANAILTVNGNQLINGTDWFALGTATDTAVSITAAVNRMGGLKAAWSGGTSGVVTATATAVGLAGNNFTLASSKLTSISTAATSFSGGRNPGLLDQWISFNGDKQYNGQLWSDTQQSSSGSVTTVSQTSTGTAISIANWLNSYGVIKATCVAGTGSVVYATATVASAAGNLFTLTASTTNLTIASALFTNGQDNASVSVNGKTFTVGVNFSTGATTSNTATSLATAITASSMTTGVAAVAAAAVVNTTATAVGINAYVMTSSSDSLLTLSGPKTITAGASVDTMTGGLASSYTFNTQVIGIPNHGFTVGLPVLFTTSTAVGITNLVWGTTYFVVVVDANNIKLSSTSAVAQTGVGLVLASSHTAVGSDTFTLTPGPFIQGPASGKWQVSNDGVNYADYLYTIQNVAVSSQTFTPVNPSTTTVQDFGPVDYGWIRYNMTGPTQGGVNLKVILNAKD